MKRRNLAFVTLAILLGAAVAAQRQAGHEGVDSSNMQLVGHDDLQGRSAYQPEIYYNRVLFVAHFNAGVRAVDVRDPFHPKEIGYYIPAVTDKTACAAGPAGQPCVKGIQTNNVEVDDRGYIYAADRAGAGLHILELSGTARQVANFR